MSLEELGGATGAYPICFCNTGLRTQKKTRKNEMLENIIGFPASVGNLGELTVE